MFMGHSRQSRFDYAAFDRTFQGARAAGQRLDRGWPRPLSSFDHGPGTKRTSTSMAKLDIDDVCMSFGDVMAVDHVSLAVAEGETVVLLGPERMRQDDAAAPDRGLQPAEGGRHSHRRQDGRVADRDGAAGEALALDGVPELRGVAAQDRVREPRLWPAAAPPGRGDDRRQGQRRARDRAHGGLRRRAIRASCRAASSSAWRSRARSCSSRKSCCSTSR